MGIRSALLSIAMLLLAPAAGAAGGLSPPPGADIWPQWQARLNVGTAKLAPSGLAAWTDPAATGAPNLQSGALLGDYYFNAPGLRLPSSLGGLRATGGLTTGARGLTPMPGTGAVRAGQRGVFSAQSGSVPLAGDGPGDTVPYLGLGYTGLAVKGGWGFTADLGVMADGPGSAGLGRALFGNQGLNSSLREMRLSPVLQVGVNYAF